MNLINFFKYALLICLLVLAAYLLFVGQELPDLPVTDQRLAAHTLVREDIFACYKKGDLKRLKRAEKNLKYLVVHRAKERATVLAWNGGAVLCRAMLALKKGDTTEFNKFFIRSTELFSLAKKIKPKDMGVASVIGGSYVIFGDRLPKAQQNIAWESAYQAFMVLWLQQKNHLGKLSKHSRGELLGGLALTAQRTGRATEVPIYLQLIIEQIPKTAYAQAAEIWQSNPQQRTSEPIICLSCHKLGKLEERIKAIESGDVEYQYGYQDE